MKSLALVLLAIGFVCAPGVADAQTTGQTAARTACQAAYTAFFNGNAQNDAAIVYQDMVAAHGSCEQWYIYTVGQGEGYDPYASAHWDAWESETDDDAVSLGQDYVLLCQYFDQASYYLNTAIDLKGEADVLWTATSYATAADKYISAEIFLSGATYYFGQVANQAPTVEAKYLVFLAYLETY